MVNGALRKPAASFAVHLRRIELPVRIDERQPRATIGRIDPPVEARPPASVTGGAGLLDPDPDRVLIAIQAHLDHALGLTGRLTFSPQRIARTAEVPGLAARDRLAQRLVIHVRDHQHVAGGSIGRDTGHEPGHVEFGLELQPFFAVMVMF